MITTKQVAVNSGAVLVYAHPDPGPALLTSAAIHIHVCNSGSKPAWVGGDSSVTPATGEQVPNVTPNTIHDRLSMHLMPGDSIYALTAGSDTTTLDVMVDG